MTKLLDANLLLALAWRNHEHHSRAIRWRDADEMKAWATCALTQLAFIRLSSNPAVVPGAVLPVAAGRLLRLMIDRSGHRFMKTPPPVTATTDPELFENLRGHRQVTDTYLVWVARHHGGCLATLDERLKGSSPWPECVELVEHPSRSH